MDDEVTDLRSRSLNDSAAATAAPQFKHYWPSQIAIIRRIVPTF
jgi:hypothetical protein